MLALSHYQDYNVVGVATAAAATAVAVSTPLSPVLIVTLRLRWLSRANIGAYTLIKHYYCDSP